MRLQTAPTGFGVKIGSKNGKLNSPDLILDVWPNSIGWLCISLLKDGGFTTEVFDKHTTPMGLENMGRNVRTQSVIHLH